jgi:hypothetical protein
VARAKVKVYPTRLKAFRQAAGLGVLNFAGAVEGGAKREAPVRGGYRSFLTTKRTKAGARGDIAVGANNGSVLIGGTLRRSIHAAVWVDGRPVKGAKAKDENGRVIPDYAPSRGILAVVGTNSEYGAFVEIGTTKMGARPFLGPSWDAQVPKLSALMRPVMKRAGF